MTRLSTCVRAIALAGVVSSLTFGAAQANDAATPAASNGAASATSGSPAAGVAAEYEPKSGQPGKDVVWVPTPQALVDRMFEMASVTRNDYLVDLGSGDGRTVITAAKRGIRAHGIEYNPDLVKLSQRLAEKEGVSDLATFEEADIFESDFSKATVVTLFLLPELNQRLRPTLLEMKPGTRVVSNTFDMGDWTPDQRIDAGGNCTQWCRAMLWIIPAKVAGTWDVGNGELQLTQTYQMLEGKLSNGSATVDISEGRMNGNTITFVADGKRYSGEVDEEGRISGTIENGGEWSATRSAS